MSATDAIGAAIREPVLEAIQEALAPLTEKLEQLLVEPRALVWTPAQAGVVLGLSDGTVRKLVHDGFLAQLPGVSNVLIPHLAIERFLESTVASQRPVRAVA